MSTVARPALYQERTQSVTAQDQINQALDELTVGKRRWRQASLDERIRLVDECLRDTMAVARQWADAACEAKGLAPGNPLQGEEIGSGPMATIRYLRLLKQTLEAIRRSGSPELPGEVRVGPSGKLQVQVMPTKGLFDGLLFQGFKSHIWLQPGVTKENLREHMASYYRLTERPEGISLVLGAGNVSSIPPTDAFTKLFHEGKVVLLKMNPVNEYLGPIFERAFRSLIEAGYLRIIYGGADVGAYAINHPQVDEVHITGSIYSHETIVWGPPGPERERRKRENDPLLKKAITSELGNVTPWIVVPGPYTDKQLRFQAENLAASITNNASFNCIATKMVVTQRGWKDRDKFLSLVDEVLARTPTRKAYYPGADERWRKFAGGEPQGCPAGTLPWKLIRDRQLDRDPLYFCEESFTCVCAETALEADSAEQFLDRATDFVNEKLWGTLGAAVMVHPKLRQQPEFEGRFQTMLDRLRYGTIGINHWPALSYAMITPPWGGYPSGTLQDPQSGIDWVHNTYMLERIEKCVLEGPLTISPKPMWFPSHRTANVVAWKALEMHYQPSIWKLPSLLFSAIQG